MEHSKLCEEQLQMREETRRHQQEDEVLAVERAAAQELRGTARLGEETLAEEVRRRIRQAEAHIAREDTARLTEEPQFAEEARQAKKAHCRSEAQRGEERQNKQAQEERVRQAEEDRRRWLGHLESIWVQKQAYNHLTHAFYQLGKGAEEAEAAFRIAEEAYRRVAANHARLNGARQTAHALQFPQVPQYFPPMWEPALVSPHGQVAAGLVFDPQPAQWLDSGHGHAFQVAPVSTPTQQYQFRRDYQQGQLSQPADHSFSSPGQQIVGVEGSQPTSTPRDTANATRNSEGNAGKNVSMTQSTDEHGVWDPASLYNRVPRNLAHSRCLLSLT